MFAKTPHHATLKDSDTGFSGDIKMLNDHFMNSKFTIDLVSTDNRRILVNTKFSYRLLGCGTERGVSKLSTILPPQQLRPLKICLTESPMCL